MPFLKKQLYRDSLCSLLLWGEADGKERGCTLLLGSSNSHNNNVQGEEGAGEDVADMQAMKNEIPRAKAVISTILPDIPK